MSTGKLTTLAIKNAKPQTDEGGKQKPAKLFDGGGLFLLINPNGSKLWRLKYRFGGRERTLSIGAYPLITLSAAREQRDEAKQLLKDGIDPSMAKQAAAKAKANAQANTFKAVGIEWYENNKKGWVPAYAQKIQDRLEKDLYPRLGKKVIADITPADVIAALKLIESRGAIETARRVKQYASKIFCYAVANGLTDTDPTRDIGTALSKPTKSHRAAITSPNEVGHLLLTLEGYIGSPVVKAALDLAPLVFVRPGELRQAEWSEIDLNDALWTIPASKMKMRIDHMVPLSCQAVAILKEIQLLTCNSPYVFPSARSLKRPMSDNAVLAAMRRLGIEKDKMCGHGFRAMARTILDEKLKFRVDYIEHQLAHAVKDPNGRSYNRTKFLEERTVMMQRWADYLDSLKEQARHGNVIAGNFGSG